MLQKLQIQNYAIIDSLEIEFSDALNIITGETGAGKSILIGALSLILGERADTSVLLDKEKKSVIEAGFSMGEIDSIRTFLKENELDAEDEIIIRREINANGKSRAFINDTPVNLTQLKELGSLLVDLHLQFDTLELGEDDFQREVVDALANQSNIIRQYQSIYGQYVSMKKKLEDLKSQQAASNKELDYIRFLFDELEEANWKENEIEDLEVELKLLGHAEQIKESLLKIYFELSESEQPIVQQLKGLTSQLHSYDSMHRDIPALVQRMQSAQIELQDIADELEQLNDHIQFDTQRIQLVNDRVSLGYKLLKKHGVRNTNELLVVQNDLQSKLDKVLNLGESIASLEKKEESLLSEANELATTLSRNRKNQVSPLERNINQLLTVVGMPAARIKIEIKLSALNSHGIDKIEFLFDANKSERFEPIRKVASGGELSRLMLCIKSLVARSIQLPTLIFDEIDTGISGEAAKQVGIIMKDLGKSHQVISITHQPQIAAKADAHYFVYKSDTLGKIKTRVRLLNENERVETIAKMLGGEKPTAAAMDNASEMIKGKSFKKEKN